jgi:hypothetical protein
VSPTPGGVLTGLAAALRVPAYLSGKRWTRLLSPPQGAGASRAAVPRGTVRVALLAVRVLARVPGLPWRNTCLYRSVAECLALRRYGVPAVVRIGVRAGEGAETPVVAHAWVVADPSAEPPPPDRMRPFSLRA